MAYLSGWTKRVPLTIDHSLVGAGGVANFPMLAPMTLPDEVVAGLANPDGRCIRFCNDAADTLYPHELVSINGAAWQAWVQMPSILSSSDTTIYMNYGNVAAEMPSASEQQATWDESAWHLDDNAATTTVVDARGTNHGANEANTATKSAVATVGKGLAYNGSTDWTTIPGAGISPTNSFRIGFWMKRNGNQLSKYVLSQGHRLSVIYGYVWESVEIYGIPYTGDDIRAGSQIVVNDDNWHRIDYCYDGTTWAGYKDGAVVFSGPRSFVLTGASGDWTLGNIGQSTIAQTAATFDEVRIGLLSRTAATIATEHANQLAPDTFSTWGPPETLSSYVPHRHYNAGWNAGYNRGVN